MNAIAVGVDGMEPSLCSQWVNDGELPNIASLMKEGVYGNADCSSLVSAKQWTNHFTGVTAEQHGITGFLKQEEIEHKRDDAPSTRISLDARKLINLSDIQSKTYPELFANAGLRVGIINPLPIWPPLRVANGFCTSGMVTPPDANETVYPSDLDEELKKFDYKIDVQYGDRPYGFIDDKLFIDEKIDLEQLRDDMFEVLENRIRYTKHTIESKELDFVYTLFKIIDIIQHAFWAHMNEDDVEFGDVILDSYKKVDEFVGWVRKNCPKTNILMFGDHGFQARRDPQFEFLHSIGYLIDTYISLPYWFKEFYRNNLKSTSDVDLSEIDGITGDHSNPAFWLMAGPKVKSRGQLDIAFEDITPTLHALVDEPIPNAYRGNPIDDALTNTPSYETVNLSVDRDDRTSVSDEVSDRLYNLGYAEMVEEG